jgi:hypothetical protein
MLDKNGNHIIPNRCYCYIDQAGEAQELYMSRIEDGEIYFNRDQYDCDKWADAEQFCGSRATDLAPHLIPA